MTTSTQEQLYFGAATLKSRGWTGTLIRRFLPLPCATRPNPHYRSGHPWKLYGIARVEEIERSEAFRAMLAETAARKERAARAMATKQENLNRHVSTIAFTVPTIARDELVKLACEHYNNRLWQRSMRSHRDDFDYRPATPSSNVGFLDRIAVNYLRHVATRYDDELGSIAGKVGVDRAYPEIVTKVLRAIATAYPWLASECERQLKSRTKQETS